MFIVEWCIDGTGIPGARKNPAKRFWERRTRWKKRNNKYPSLQLYSSLSSSRLFSVLNCFVNGNWRLFNLINLNYRFNWHLQHRSTKTMASRLSVRTLTHAGRVVSNLPRVTCLSTPTRASQFSSLSSVRVSQYTRLQSISNQRTFASSARMVSS